MVRRATLLTLFRRAVALLAWGRSFCEGRGRTFRPKELALECPVCFEAFTPVFAKSPCALCGSTAAAACPQCLRTWSWSSGRPRHCVVCRDAQEAGDDDVWSSARWRRLQEASPAQCAATVFLYCTLHYAWLLVCYKQISDRGGDPHAGPPSFALF